MANTNPTPCHDMVHTMCILHDLDQISKLIGERMAIMFLKTYDEVSIWQKDNMWF